MLLLCFYDLATNTYKTILLSEPHSLAGANSVCIHQVSKLKQSFSLDAKIVEILL